MLEVLKTLTSLWHVVAFSCGFLFVFQSYLALFGRAQYDRSHNHIIRINAHPVEYQGKVIHE